jgi:hypothetical protein
MIVSGVRESESAEAYEKERRGTNKKNIPIFFRDFKDWKEMVAIVSVYASSWYICYNPSMNEHPNDPLFGKTLQSILEYLVKEYGWQALGESITIKCFTTDPSISSSLTFLRKTPWARAKVEELYIATIGRPTR